MEKQHERPLQGPLQSQRDASEGWPADPPDAHVARPGLQGGQARQTGRTAREPEEGESRCEGGPRGAKESDHEAANHPREEHSSLQGDEAEALLTTEAADPVDLTCTSAAEDAIAIEHDAELALEQRVWFDYLQ